jgi:hypothetical protein
LYDILRVLGLVAGYLRDGRRNDDWPGLEEHTNNRAQESVYDPVTMVAIVMVLPHGGREVGRSGRGNLRTASVYVIMESVFAVVQCDGVHGCAF